MGHLGRVLGGGVCLVVLLGGWLQAGTYGGGSGTAADPYRIYTPEHLVELGNMPLDWGGKHFSLEADIDMEGIEMEPIGGQIDPYHLSFFRGVFDGNHHTILNLTIDRPDLGDVGLFGYVGTMWGEKGSIYNLHLDNVCIRGGSEGGGFGCAGGLVSELSAGEIINCSTSGSVAIEMNDSHYKSWAGGIAGINLSGRIEGCYSSCDVTVNSSIGEAYAGGLAGMAEGQCMIVDCYATGAVSGRRAGGFVGTVYYGQLFNCYSSGAVSGSGSYNYLGGFAGTCYSNSPSSFEACFWNMEESGQSIGIRDGNVTSVEVRGRTSAQMMTAGTFTEYGWDFAGEMANGTGETWRLCADGVQRPRLAWESGVYGDIACPDGVGMEDLAVLATGWLTARGGTDFTATCDANGDGKIDFEDFNLLSQNWR